MKTKFKLPGSNDIEEMVKSISIRPFPRLINFCDIINRYIDIVFKDRIDWLKTMALIVMFNLGNGSMPPRDLARNLLRSNQSITKLTDALEKDGSIVRERSSEDRRAIHLRVTTKGLAYLQERLKDIDLADQMLRSCLDENEIQSFFVMTRKVRRGAIKEVGNKKGKSTKPNGQMKNSENIAAANRAGR
ncbi:MAG TPA: MarR family transcriptional regulator [Syntrophorhabdaceae bacterium]|nr:MarR family transcriptional regulator [Syntrophorhabdaceae bacterium]